ncbi:MAG: EamA family transporter [Oscillochloris sp.]|nr:EamA family transporter [Oscillochloris sp.]
MNSSTRFGYILCILAAITWAATSPGLSYLLDGYGAHALAAAFWRDAVIAVALLTAIGGAVLLGRCRVPQLSAPELRGFALAGVISIGIYHALFVSSIALNGAALGIVLIYLYPTFVTIGARLLFQEAISTPHVIGLGLALLGCVLLVQLYDLGTLRTSWLGIVVGIGSALTHAVYVLFNQRAVSRVSPWLSLALTMSFGTLTLLIVGLAVIGPTELFRLGPQPGFGQWWLVLAIALGPTLIGYALFTISLRHIPGRIASLIVVIEAPIATLLAVVLLGEQVAPLQVVGMALILIAAILPGLSLRLPGRRPAAVGS